MIATGTKQGEAGHDSASSAAVVNVGIGDDKENVVLKFDQKIDWLKMPPVMAIKIAEMMKEKAIEILRSNPCAED